MILPTIITQALLLPIVLAGFLSSPSAPDSSELANATSQAHAASMARHRPPPKTAILPGNPTWCKFKHKYFDNWVAVYSRDWGYDDCMRGFLDNLRGV
ncbi:hypothetical protein VP1G_04605 [Cytospora mali]|uniref:Uncharacterized protein n=1 Tax=Cytospora mali TaxID=578113 RepID=A0A194V057_CYTMA|nr:hypothetical protein VP1G_04605 [Valsa mali var. pyri (nom. inval.)]